MKGLFMPVISRPGEECAAPHSLIPSLPPDGLACDLSSDGMGAVAAWAGGRVVECTGLENRRTLAGLVGSNPTLPVKLEAIGRSPILAVGCTTRIFPHRTPFGEERDVDSES